MGSTTFNVRWHAGGSVRIGTTSYNVTWYTGGPVEILTIELIM